MSRITFPTKVLGTSVHITVGWDRPLQQCFLDVALDDEQEQLPEYEALTLLSEQTALVPLTVEEVEAALATARVELPPGVISELLRHRDDNVGNLIVRFDEQGVRTQLN